MKKLANFLRLFWGCVFLAGGVFNLVIALIDKTLHNNGGNSAWPDFPGNFWANTVMSNLLRSIVILGVIQLILGLLILNKGKWAKLGLIGAVICGAGLLMIGLGAGGSDWLAARGSAGLAFEAMMIYCLFFNYDKTFIRTLRRNKDLTHTAVVGS